MIEKRVRVLLAELILLTLILNILLIGLETDSSIANVTGDFETLVETEEISQLNSRGGPFIIDLNTETDRPHHNITICGAEEWDQAGWLMTAGDINGDSFDDLLISIYAKDISHYGKVYAIFGKPIPDPIIDLNSADIIFYGADYDDFLGRYALTTGDVNNDEIDDILISATGGNGKNEARDGCGEVYIVYGNESLPSEWKFSQTPADVTIYGIDKYDSIGQSITIGDVNGDGIDDIIIGATNALGPNNQRKFGGLYRGCGEVYAVLGNSSLPSKIELSTSAYITVYGAKAGDYIGNSIASGDLNSDNYDDIIINAFRTSKAYVIYGNGNISQPITIDLLNTSANITIHGVGSTSLTDTTTGDLNGDNIDDLILIGYGIIYVIYGNSSFQSNISMNAIEADCMINYKDKLYNWRNLATGNINNDGFDELMIGGFSSVSEAHRYGAGGAYVINGSISLPDKINLANQTSDIEIYGAEASRYLGDNPDSAGASIIIADFNGDNKGDLFLGATGGDGRNNEKEDSGEIFVILSGGDVQPIPIVDSVSLENGEGIDKDICYAKYEPYQFKIRVLTPNDPNELNSLTLSLDYGSGHSNLQFKWMKDLNEFIEARDPNDYTALTSQSSSSNYKRTWTIMFHIIFNWSYPDNNLHTVQVQTTGNTGLLDWLNLTIPMYCVKNKLNFTGNTIVTAEHQGGLTDGGWIRGGEQLTWSGLTLIYEDSQDIYPPDDSGVTVTVKDSSVSSWTVSPSPGNEISIDTTAVNETNVNETYAISITNVPPSCDVSNVIFILNIDADVVRYSNSYPNNDSWQATLRPQCGIRIIDPSTRVDPSSVQYRISLDNSNGTNWNNWTQLGLQYSQDDIGINCSVKPIFSEGITNFIQWRAKDLVGNKYNSSVEHRILIDISNVTFTNPTPLPDDWQKNATVTCGITVNDLLSGVNASSIEFSTTTSGIWEFGDWQPARKIINDNSIQCTVTPTFTSGTENYIRWRAKDVVGNGYRTSENFQIKVKINHPPVTKLLSPVNKSILKTLAPELAWEGSDPDNDTNLRYDVYLSPVKDFVLKLNKTGLIQSKTTETKLKIQTSLLDKVTYYWTVVPHDGTIFGKCGSGYWQFKVDKTIEVPYVTLTEPMNNSNVSTTKLKLSWDLNYSDSEKITYKIYLARSLEGKDIISNEFLYKKDYKVTTFIFDTLLTPGYIYSWTVIPVALEPEGVLNGICRSGVWNFMVELPQDNVYQLDMSIKVNSFSVTQGNYTSTSVTIINLGNTADMIQVSINKGILEANVGIERGDAPFRLDINENIILKLEILVSDFAKPQNYTINITAISNGAIADGKEVIITKSVLLQVLEKEKVEDDTGKGEERTGEINFIIWIILVIIIILIIGMFIYIHRSRRVPYVKSELLAKPPEYLRLPGISSKPGTDLELPAAGEEGVVTLEGATVPAAYLLPKALLSREQKLVLLKERFILGEVSEETYKELKAELESTEEKDITKLDEVEPGEEEISAEEPPLDEEPLEEKDLEKEMDQEPLPPEPEVEDVEEEESRVVEELEKELGEEIVEEEPGLEEEKLGKPLITKKRPKVKKKKKAKRPNLMEKRNEGPVEEPVAEDEMHDIPEEAYPFPDDGLCISCGQNLDPDMAYCWSCGTKYEKKDVGK